MNTSRKRPRVSEVERLRAQNVRLRRALKSERAQWFEKCPLGHLVRYDECDITCWVTNIDPLPGTLLMVGKVGTSITLHDWLTDSIPNEAGWWWRYPYFSKEERMKRKEASDKERLIDEIVDAAPTSPYQWGL